MTTLEIDPLLSYLTRRAPRRKDGLTPEQVLAINWFWRNGAKVTMLAKMFKVSPNTIYYRCTTGTGSSYPKAGNSAQETNDLVDLLGPDEIKRRFVTPDMILALNAAMEKRYESSRSRSGRTRGTRLERDLAGGGIRGNP